MANLVLTINNNKFESANGAVSSFSPTKVVGLGWSTRINDDNSLEAFCKSKVEEGTYSVKVLIEKGKILVTKRLVLPDGSKKNLGKEEQWVPGINGILTLSGGDIKEREVTHLHKGQLNFQKAFSIEKIVHTEPNQIYEVNVNTEVHTDGKCTKVLKSKDECLLEVSDATWVLLEQPINAEENRILYTELPYNKIVFPELLSSMGRCKYTSSLTKEFESVEEALKYVDTLNLFKKRMYVLEDYTYDEIKVNASYYLDANGYLSVYLSRTAIWNSRDSFESSKVNPEIVKETKDYFSKTDRILEGLGYVEK